MPVELLWRDAPALSVLAVDYRVGVTLAARHPHLMQPNRLRLGAGPSSSPRLPQLVKRPIGGGIGVDGETDHMLGDANDFVRDVSRIRWTAA
jgi:hypothetical protein